MGAQKAGAPLSISEHCEGVRGVLWGIVVALSLRHQLQDPPNILFLLVTLPAEELRDWTYPS